ncbi:putative acyltransferase [Klebsiella pneumoniae]|nr:putative acyltransferase [Klebsiella pneumoniae]
MSRLLAAITLPLSIALTILVTIICSVPIIVAGLIKLLVPIPAVWRSISVFCNFMMYCWCEGLALLLHLNPWLKWDVQGLEGLNKKNWYLLISNHHSWADIVVLCVLFRKHIPMNKYFLKQQLAWVPFIGLACWALDMPFMRRYSRSYLIRHPERRGKDVETTRRSCENFARIRRLSSILWKARVLPKKKSAKRALLTTTCYRRKPLVSPWRSTYSVRSSINC